MTKPPFRPEAGGGPGRRPTRRPRAARAAFLLACALGAAGACGDRPAANLDPALAARPLPGPDTPVDTALARAGADLYRRKCLACHKIGGGDAVGPDLHGVTRRRDWGWIRAMVLSPDSMLREDSVARALLGRYMVPMIDTELGEPAFRAVLEYLRSDPAGPP